MFPNKLFPVRSFPDQVYPFGIGSLVHKYSEILLYIKSILEATEMFGPVRVPIVIHGEPFPLNAGPCAYIIPGHSTTIESQHMGDGRFFYGFTGHVTVRVVDRDLRDYTGSKEIALTAQTTGLLRRAHKVIDLLDLEFAQKVSSDQYPSPIYLNRTYAEKLFPSLLFPRSQSLYENLTQEPIVLVSQSPVTMYSNGSEWSAVDLDFRFPYTVEFQRDTHFEPSPATDEPTPTNLADLLLAVKSQILSQGFLNTFKAMISIKQDPFPLTGGPFAIINPGEFSAVEYDKYGAGRNYASMEGYFNVNPAVRNMTDITGYATNALTGSLSDISLYSAVQFLMEQLCMSFLYDADGNFLAEVPLDLVQIGAPRYFGGHSGYVTLPLVFRTKYQEALT